MTKKQLDRQARLLPGGIPRYVRIYDDGPDGSVDRFTVVFTGRMPGMPQGRTWHPYLAMSGAPFHPQGFCQHGETPGKPCDVVGSRWGGPGIGKRCHLGRRIHFADLPPDCQKAALADYRSYWGLT